MQKAMLEVSGVGQNKLMKYGQRFVNEIDTFVKNIKEWQQQLLEKVCIGTVRLYRIVQQKRGLL